MTYYNTTSIEKESLIDAWTRTAIQDELVLSVFIKHKEILFTPFEIQTFLSDDYNKNFPITSIRRSMNTLTQREALEKTSVRKKGLYGVTNYCWKYKE